MEPSKLLLYYLVVFIVLLLTELYYVRIASQYNIIDKPNQRSSHSQITLRGGGIIFPVSVGLFFLLQRLQYGWFVLGLMAIALISFTDDIREQSRLLRLSIHAVAVCLLLYQAGLLSMAWDWWPAGFILVTGI